MNKYDRLILNKVNIFLAECYENNTIIHPKKMGVIFKNIFEKDVNYIRLCPPDLANSLQELAKDIYMNEQYLADFKELLKVFLVAYYDTISYQSIKLKKIPPSQKDKFWYKSFWGEFIIQNLLYKNSNGKMFKSDYAQVGELIARFYKEKEKNKASIIKKMILSKLNDIFSRYDYKYAFPLLEQDA